MEVEMWSGKKELKVGSLNKRKIFQMTSGGRYVDGRGDMKGTSSNGEDLPMYAICNNSWNGTISLTNT